MMFIGELFGAAFKSIGSFFKKGNYAPYEKMADRAIYGAPAGVSHTGMDGQIEMVKNIGRGYSDHIVGNLNDTTDKLDAISTHYADRVATHTTKVQQRVEKANNALPNLNTKLSELTAKQDEIRGRLNTYDDGTVDVNADAWTPRHQVQKEYDSVTKQVTKLRKQIGKQETIIGDADSSLIAQRIDAGFGQLYDSAGALVGGTVGLVGTTVGKAAGDIIRGAGATVGAAAKSGLEKTGTAIGYGLKGVGHTIGFATSVAENVGVPIAKGVVKGAGNVAWAAGDQAFAGAKFMWNTRDSRLMQVGIMTMGVPFAAQMAWQEGTDRQRVSNKVSSNFEVSSDNGGLLLRGGSPAPITEGVREGRYTSQAIAQHEASGDLVFALHNLRNGG